MKEKREDEKLEEEGEGRRMQKSGVIPPLLLSG